MTSAMMQGQIPIILEKLVDQVLGDMNLPIEAKEQIIHAIVAAVASSLAPAFANATTQHLDDSTA